MVCKTFFDKVSALVTDLRFLRKHYFPSVKNSLISHNSHLRFVVSKRFLTEQQLKENYANWPNIYFGCYLWIHLVEALWSLIPIGSHSLRSQLNLILTLIESFAKSKISYFDFSIVENYILRL